MTNKIEHIRETAARALESAQVCPEQRCDVQSPCGRYQLRIEGYAVTNAADITRLTVGTVCCTITGEEVATVIRNYGRCFYAWISRDGHDYLLFPEDLEGQTVIDLTARQVIGFSPPDAGFIWTEFYPSPDKIRLAIVGCYWACPYQVTVYDFSDPLNLPLPVLAEFELPENDEEFGEWLTSHSFSVVAKNGCRQVFEFPL